MIFYQLAFLKQKNNNSGIPSNSNRLEPGQAGCFDDPDLCPNVCKGCQQMTQVVTSMTSRKRVT